MKSIQTKVIIIISVMMLVTTGILMATAMLRNRGILDADSEQFIELTIESNAQKIDKILSADPEGGIEANSAAVRGIVSNITLYNSKCAFVLKANGDIIYHEKYPDGKALSDLPALEQQHFKDVLKLKKNEVIRGHICLDGGPARIEITELSDGSIFGIRVSRSDIAVQQIRLVFRLFVTSVLCLILSILIGAILVRSVIKPLRKMTDVADRYAEGDFSEPMTVESKDEVGRLSRSLQSMSTSLVHQIERADAANHSKSAFLSTMSHDIRTPITSVLGFNEMILRESEDKDILLYAENIKTSGNMLLGLINDILDFSKIEAGKLEIVPGDYDLSSTINDLVNMVRVRAEEKDLELKIDIDRNLPRVLNGDEIRIKQVITNILSNAVKYTEKGSVTFCMGYSDVAGDENSIMLNVSVKDTGIGIKPEDMKKLFSEFERLDEKRNKNVEGTGLGMAITKSMLGLMGSEIRVESTYGEGSTFSFELKQKVVSREPLGDYKESLRRAEEKALYKSGFVAPDAHVLMVDDNSMNLLLFKSLVKQSRIVADTAASGNECLHKCCKTKYDIIFLDHMMPGKDGIETLRELKAMQDSPNAATPVICLTANAMAGAREEYLSYGFTDYLTKPIDPEKLDEMLLHYLPSEKVDRSGKAAETPAKAAKSVARSSKPADENATGLAALEGQTLIDAQTGIQHCLYEDLYLEVLGVFYDAVDQNIEKLSKYSEPDGLKTYVITSHSIKSAARTIGAADLGEKAAAMEAAGKEGNIAYIDENLEDFVKDYREVIALVKRVINR